MPIDMIFKGPIKVHVKEYPKQPKNQLKIDIQITNEKVLFNTGLYAPLMADVEQSMVGAAFDVLRALCLAFEDPAKFRRIILTGDPEKEGIPVSVPEQSVEEWIEAAQEMKEQLKIEACPLAAKWDAGEEVSMETK